MKREVDWNRIKLIALMTIIFVPIASATWFFVRSEGVNIGATTNKGELISPVLDITELGLIGSEGENLFQTFEETVAGIDPDDYEPRPWMLVYLGREACNESCQERLYFLRQLHRRLGAEARRVERWYAVVGDGSVALRENTAAHFAETLPDMKVAATEENSLRDNLARTHSADVDPVDEHYIYVVDPVGNVMLYFTPEQTPEDILSDIEKLLDQSSLG